MFSFSGFKCLYETPELYQYPAHETISIEEMTIMKRPTTKNSQNHRVMLKKKLLIEPKDACHILRDFGSSMLDRLVKLSYSRYYFLPWKCSISKICCENNDIPGILDGELRVGE